MHWILAQTTAMAAQGILHDAEAFARRDQGMTLVVLGLATFVLPRLLKTYWTIRYSKLPQGHPARAKKQPTYKITETPRHLMEWVPHALLLAGIYFLTR